MIGSFIGHEDFNQPRVVAFFLPNEFIGAFEQICQKLLIVEIIIYLP